MKKPIDNNYWLEKWKARDIRFHRDAFHPALDKYFPKATLSGNTLVPLCGKSLDLIWLSRVSRKVIGVELTEEACEEFFKENKIAVEETKHGAFVIYDSPKIQIWCGDFFNLPKEVWKDVARIYDRAALIALPPDLRRRYAKTIRENTKTDVEMLLICAEYRSEHSIGPPFPVMEKDVRELYEEYFSMRQVYRELDPTFASNKNSMVLKFLRLDIF